MASHNSHHKQTILVVDDDRDMVDSTVMVLSFLGYAGEGAYDAEMALAIARVRPPQVVLLDAAMPGQDGYSLARRLRLLPGMGDALLICVSGYGTAEHRTRALAAGCDRHFIKPLDWPELVRMLHGERQKEPA
jgi:two-component system CheB/CheR fusion protein